MDENVDIVVNPGADPSHPDSIDHTARDIDRAFWYVQESSFGNDAYTTSASDLKTLRRKIDWHIVPIMFCCYTM